MVDDLTPLARPMGSQVTIDPIAKECPSSGFNYPVFRQLNKQARLYLSRRLNLNPSVLYRLFSVANSKGWFAAVQVSPSGSNIMFSTLEDLRLAFSESKEGAGGLFSPKRVLPVGSVNIIALASHDTRLVIGLESGSVMIYDTALLFTPGTGEISALKVLQMQPSPLRQILPNPGMESILSDLIAIVGEGKVILLNLQLESQGGWIASDLMTQPISVSWSPKGRHIAIGLQTGDILTYNLTSKSTPNKHIPSTADAILVSLHWLGPGHTMRTTYAAQDNAPAKQHIITPDAKSSTATYVAPDHPFPANDRTQQNSYLLSFPKWDEDNTPNGESKTLTVVGDYSSVDIEVLGNIGHRWFRQSQDNPLTLPLDSLMEDTVLLSLESDLTDTTTGAPIVYAYLNDGSLQGWHAEHSKSYVGLLSSGASSSLPVQPQETRDTEMVSDNVTPTSTSTGFGQTNPSFGEQSTAFGQTPFRQPQTTSNFGQPAFGQLSFGQASFPQTNQATNNATSAFGASKPATGFGAFASTGSGAFGSTSSVFSGFSSAAPSGNTFSQGNFSSTAPAKSADTLSPNMSPTITQEATMSDSTAGFGGMSLGSVATDSGPVNSTVGIFGAALPNTSSQVEPSGFGNGQLVKPASGFGAFGSFKTGGAFDLSNKPSSTVNAFASPVNRNQTTSSGFGQAGFGQPSFGQTGFGQPAFGKTSFGATPTSSSTSGGFGAFANAPASFTSPTTKQQSPFGTKEPKSEISGGFAAFASTTPFGSTPMSLTDASTSKPPSVLGMQEPKPENFGAFAPPVQTPFASTTSDSSSSGIGSATKTLGGFGSASSFNSRLGTTSEPSNQGTPAIKRTSVFGTPVDNFRTTPASTTPAGAPARNIAISPPSSPEPRPPLTDSSPKPVGSAFANIQTTPSSIFPAVGFGAFGSTTPKNSPFFKKSEQTTLASPFTPISSGSKTSGSTTPSFGSTSVLGPSKSAFGPTTPTTPTTPTPVKPATTPLFGGSAFSAFSGSSSPLSVVANQKKSFSDLLKTGGEENKDPAKTSASVTEEAKPKSGEVVPTTTRVSVFGTPTRDEAIVANAAKSDDKEKGESKGPTQSEPTSRDESLGNISASSNSSFVEVEIPKDEGGLDDHSDQDDQSDFLSDDEELSASGRSDEEDGSEGGELESATPSPIAIPLPLSRSPSATPQPEVKIRLPTPPIPESSSENESTTPPGTPAKETKSPAGLGSVTTPLGIGLGRPNTRPVRRSPLANAVTLVEDESQEQSLHSDKPKDIPSSDKKPDPTPSGPLPPSTTTAFSLKTPALDAVVKKPPVPIPSSIFSFGSRPVTTPPMSGLSADKPVSAVSSSSTPRATTTPASFSLFGAQPKTEVPNVFNMPSFTLNKTTMAAGTTNIFGAPSSQPTFNPLPKSTPQGTVDRVTSTSPVGRLTGAQPSKNRSQEVIEEGMQQECVNLVKTIEKEIQELSNTAVNARHVYANLNVSLGGSSNQTELGNLTKWGLADLNLFGQVLLQFEGEMGLLKSNRDEELQAIGEIKSNILKAGTRREEIARFNRAKDDKEFAKMLKARTLGPEHSETQIQLRKSVRAVRDRVQKLEKRLHDDKRRLTEAQTCKPRVKAPSLDTINRTYRNIGVAIEQQTEEISRLATRVSNLHIVDAAASSSLDSSLVKSDTRLLEPPNRLKLVNVTPHVAITTAAALNAERSAQKLKKALLAVRKEPLLNTRAAEVAIAPQTFISPAKPVQEGNLKGFGDLKGPLFPDATQKSELEDDWNLPEDHFEPGGPHESLGGGGSTRSHKPRRSHRGGGSVGRKSPAPENITKPEVNATPPSSKVVPVSFDWGPLPKFATPTPLKTLPISFVPISSPTSEGDGGKLPSTPPQNVPKGFVSFSNFTPTTSPSNGSAQIAKGFTFAPSTT